MFDIKELSKNQIEFLEKYSPKEEGFTSSLEIKQVISKLGLDEGDDVETLRSIRNSVVDFYSKLLDNDFKYMESMQSITAVIDHQIYKINPMSV